MSERGVWGSLTSLPGGRRNKRLRNLSKGGSVVVEATANHLVIT